MFVNLGVISSFNFRQDNRVAKSHFSTLLKRRKMPESVSTSFVRENAMIEICEEGLDDDDDELSKTNAFFFIQTFYSFLVNKAVSLKPDHLFGFVNCKLSSRKYLAISVLRI
jgi:hypothetical protein